MIKSRKLKWAGYIVRMEEGRTFILHVDVNYFDIVQCDLICSYLYGYSLFYSKICKTIPCCAFVFNKNISGAGLFLKCVRILKASFRGQSSCHLIVPAT